MNTQMTGRNVTWKTPDITGTGLKLFACIAMLLQSIGVVIVENGMIHLSGYTQAELSEAMAQDSHLMTLAGIGSVLQLAGGIAVPIFAFLLVEGFKNTSDYRKYLLTMLVFAVLSEIPYDFAVQEKLFDFSSQNALVSMVICLLLLYYLDMVKEKSGVIGVLLRVLLVFGAVVWVTLLRAEYGFCLVLLTAVFYLFYSRNVLKTILGILISLLYVTGPFAFYGIWCYNEKRGDRFSKYVFYVFYPVHLLVLGLIARYLL
jgi:hypothetical protein